MDELTLMCQLYAKGTESVEKLKKMGLSNATSISNTPSKKLSTAMGISETMAKRMIAHCTRMSEVYTTVSERGTPITTVSRIPITKTLEPTPISTTRISEDELNSLAGPPKVATKPKVAKDVHVSKPAIFLPIWGGAHRIALSWIRDGQAVVKRMVNACFFWRPYVNTLVKNCKGLVSHVTPKFW